MSFLFCFTTVNVLSSISMMFKYGMTTGGPAVMIWAWIVGATLNVIAGFSMAEICSSYPTAGSVYHWTALLAPKKSAAITAFMCG
jgi:amino acid transporter